MQILLGLDILSLSGLAMICTDYEALMYLTVYNFDSTLYYFVEPFVCAKKVSLSGIRPDNETPILDLNILENTDWP